MTRLILVRHGQSLANAGHLFAGHTDFELSELGHKQASMAARYLFEHEPIGAIYASDLLRAYHTALPIGETFGLPVIKDKGLREIFAGEWEGMAMTRIAEEYPEAFRIWREDYGHSGPVGGESTKQVYERIVPHICELAEKSDGSCILLATHATVVRAFDSFARGYSWEETGRIGFYPNASLNIYTYEKGKVSVVRSAITEHLGDLTTTLPPIINP